MPLPDLTQSVHDAAAVLAEVAAVTGPVPLTKHIGVSSRSHANDIAQQPQQQQQQVQLVRATRWQRLEAEERQRSYGKGQKRANQTDARDLSPSESGAPMLAPECGRNFCCRMLISPPFQACRRGTVVAC